MSMTQQSFGSTAENYQHLFVPTIGAPMAEDLVPIAALRRGERVLDVACGTGVVTRMAAAAVGQSGSVAGLDIAPAMLKVARESTPDELGIQWCEADAEALPFADGTFDVVLCQMGLQFFPDPLGALREMRRVLAPGGRAVLNVPGPTPPLFAAMEEALGKHVGARAAGFAHTLFSLHDPRELRALMTGAGFADVDVTRATRTLALPPAREFLWQYLYSTPLGAVVGQARQESRGALEEEVCAGWETFANGAGMKLEVPMTTVVAR